MRFADRMTTPRIRTGPIRSIRAGAVGSVFDAPARISNTAARAACHALSCTLVLVDAGKCADGNRHAIRQARCSGHDIAQVDGGNAAGALQERAGAVWPGSKMIGRPIVSPGTRRSPGSHGMPIPVRFAASIGCGAVDQQQVPGDAGERVCVPVDSAKGSVRHTVDPFWPHACWSYLLARQVSRRIAPLSIELRRFRCLLCRTAMSSWSNPARSPQPSRKIPLYALNAGTPPRCAYSTFDPGSNSPRRTLSIIPCIDFPS